MNKPIVLWGATGQARVLAEFLPHLGYKVVAYFDNNSDVKSPLEAVPIHHGREAFVRWRNSNPAPVAGLAAIGGDRGADRLEILSLFETHDVEIVIVLHPRAFVAGDVRLGAGCQVLAQAVVAAGSSLGRACLINHNASVDHECVLGDGVHIAPGATVCGSVSIGPCSLVGAGAVVLPRIRLGRSCMVGAGAVVTADVPDNVVAFGNPARIIRARENRPTAA